MAGASNWGVENNSALDSKVPKLRQVGQIGRLRMRWRHLHFQPATTLRSSLSGFDFRGGDARGRSHSPSAMSLSRRLVRYVIAPTAILRA